MKRLIFLILLFLSCKQVVKEELNNENHSQVQYYISLDKDKTLNERLEAINKSLSFTKKSDSLFTEKLYQKQFLHFSLGQYDSVIEYSSEIEKNATSVKDYLYAGKQHHLVGYYYDEVLTNFDSAFYHYNLSKSYFLKLNDSTSVGRRLMSMGLIQKNQNDFFGSKETLTEALQFLNPQSDSKYIATCYNAMATNHRKLLNKEDAIRYYSKAIEATDSESDRLIYQNNQATTYIDMIKYDRAIELLREIVKDSNLIKSKREYARVLDNLAYAQWRYGKESDSKAFLNPLIIRKQNNDQRGKIASYTHLGEFYGKKNPRKAVSYFDSVIKYSRSLKMPRAEKDALKFLMKLKPKNVNLRDRYVFLQDSLYAQELKVKTQFAKYKYDDKLKQESILRLEKENAEKELEVIRQRTQKIIFSTIGAFILALFGFVGYYFVQRTKRLRQEKETAALEATYKTEEELSRRLHDDYGGRLNQTMLLVQNNADKLLILDSLEELYDQSRNFSREINDVDTGEDFWEGLLAMLQFKTPSKARLFLKGGKETNWSSVPALTKKVIFKVLQELMINMVRHSQASVIAVTFETIGKTLKISYADDGIGASKKAMHLKNGLRNTEKRIRAIHGTITFDSKEGDGFRAHIEIPK